MREVKGTPPRITADFEDYIGLDRKNNLLINPRIKGVFLRGHAHPCSLGEDNLILMVMQPGVEAHLEPFSVIALDAAKPGEGIVDDPSYHPHSSSRKSPSGASMATSDGTTV